MPDTLAPSSLETSMAVIPAKAGIPFSKVPQAHNGFRLARSAVYPELVEGPE
ncbi:MAG TPA: hypothetical protein VFK31_04985 [Rhodanobacteraceae bacterium]|nr:hypothetical protein [Rhodanobacteraceae bacterium]